MKDSTKNKLVFGAAVVTAAGYFAYKRGTELNAAELEDIAKAMKDLGEDQADKIEALFHHGKNGSEELKITTSTSEGNTTYGFGTKYTGLTKESVSATLITNKDGQVIGWYYKTGDNTYNVFYQGKQYDNVTGVVDQNGVRFQSGSGDNAQEIFTSNPTTGEVKAGGRVIGKATPPPEDGTKNLDIYRDSNAAKDNIRGYIETTNGNGWVKDVGFGQHRDDLETLKNRYLELINQSTLEGKLDPDLAKKLTAAIEAIDIKGDEIRTVKDFNEAVQKVFGSVEKTGALKKGYEDICQDFNNSELVKKINELAGSDVISSEAITTLAVAGCIVGAGVLLLKNQDKVKKVVVSLASSFSNKSNDNSHSRY